MKRKHQHQDKDDEISFVPKRTLDELQQKYNNLEKELNDEKKENQRYKWHRIFNLFKFLKSKMFQKPICRHKVPKIYQNPLFNSCFDFRFVLLALFFLKITQS